MIKPSLTALAACLALSSPVLAEKLPPERIFADPGLTGPIAKGVALSPDGKRVYAGNLGDNSLSVIDVASKSVVATITGFKEPRQAIVFTRDGTTAYVLNEDLGIAKVDLARNRVEATLEAPAAKMQLTAP